MRILWLIGSLALLSACSSYRVHCDKHLRPINVPAPVSGSGAAPGKP